MANDTVPHVATSAGEADIDLAQRNLARKRKRLTDTSILVDAVVGLVVLTVSLLLIPRLFSAVYAYLVGIIVALLCLSTTSVKLYLTNTLSTLGPDQRCADIIGLMQSAAEQSSRTQIEESRAVLKKTAQELLARSEPLQKISEVMSELGGAEYDEARRVVSAATKDVQELKHNGRVLLHEGEYFDRIIDGMKQLRRKDSVKAVSRGDALRWRYQTRQIAYLNANIEAAESNRAVIERLFILSAGDVTGTKGIERLEIMKRQADTQNIDVRVIEVAEAIGYDDQVLKDSVMFVGHHGTSKRLFVEKSDPHSDTILAYLKLRDKDLAEFEAVFDRNFGPAKKFLDYLRELKGRLDANGPDKAAPDTGHDTPRQ